MKIILSSLIKSNVELESIIQKSNQISSPDLFIGDRSLQFLFAGVVKSPMMTDVFFRVTGPLCGEFTCHRWIPLTKAMTRNFDVSLMLVRANSLINHRDAGHLRRHGTHCDGIVMYDFDFLLEVMNLRGSNY